MNNSRWGGSIPINRLLKKPNLALNKETNSHPAKTQTLAQIPLNFSSPKSSSHTAAVRAAAPLPLPEHPGVVSAPYTGMSSRVPGNPAGVAGGSDTEDI